MRKRSFLSFFAGMMAAALIFGCLTTTLAAANVISFNKVNLSVNGETMFAKEDYLETSAGQKIPSSILYTDALGGGTTYLPTAYLSKIFDMPITWDGETGTVVLGTAPIVPAEDLLQHLAEQWLVDGDYPKNSKGETYGPDTLELLLGYRPDLIAAGATNGAEGYIRRTDMEEFERLLLEDFTAISASGKPYVVPVYDLEGNVIGEFELNK